MHGVAVHFVVYDLLPVLIPEAFEPGTQDVHANWLKAISEADGAICISRSVADELKQWVETQTPEASRRLKISWFHLGANLQSASSRHEITAVGSGAILRSIRSAPSFLMVGTIEPRKGHAQVLSAFEELWRAGQNVNLVIVGKQGWLVDSLAQYIHSHPESGKRLFWLSDASDSLLEELYNGSACLIAASKGEGFGLPLIEAAHHRLPIIARDIPVFREVAKEHAFYFSGADSQSLASSVGKWLELHDRNEHPQSAGLEHLSWNESAIELMRVLLGSNGAR
ncbi:Glycosyltransferase Gtf1 [compost metagenome]